MTRGVLNPDEPDSIKLIREIAVSMVGTGSQGPDALLQRARRPAGQRRESHLSRGDAPPDLAGPGLLVKSINEGLAVVYAEMESTNYTGIGISCGGGLCNVCLSYLSVPVFSFSIPKAGDFIDNSAASVTGERANRIRI